MTEEQTLKRKEEQNPGVILSERFLHRVDSNADENWFMFADADQILNRLAEHFALVPFNLDDFNSIFSDGQVTIKEDMPRFQQSQRDGLHVPKEGQDGTGN
ncbi:MAG: hypothetical protein JXX29_08425 [Deltaproteobacteria bacterium]|nr:hypothetical protein [Deltaproteobacteria bacterium]MBN2671686.1 hypothetical protein [Deltaproteobacteria bacterium]